MAYQMTHKNSFNSFRMNIKRYVLRLGALSAMGVSMSTAIAQTDAVPAPITFEVSQFSIDGDNPLDTALTKAVLAPFTEKNISIAQLNDAANSLEDELARRGYNFYQVILPPQKLKSGDVQLRVERIQLDKVNVIGNQFFSSNNIKRSMPMLRSGSSPNTQTVASALTLADENPAKDIRVIFVKGEQPSTVDANITVKDQNPNEFFLWANNAGSRSTSRSRLGLQYHNRNLWGLDHQMSLSYSVSPEEPSELSQYGINYRVPVYRLGGVSNFYYSRSDADTGRVADVFDVSGAGESFGAGYTQLLSRIGDYQHRVSVNIADKLFDSDILFNAQNIGTDVRSRPLSISYTSRLDDSNWAFNSVVTAATNLSGGNFNDDASYALSRVGASSDWDKFGVNMRYDYRWSEKWTTRVVGSAQFSSDALIAGEKFGLGGSAGTSGPRGFFEREATVDEGYKISMEALRSFGNGRVRVGAFFDYGAGDQNNAQFGEIESQTLSSVGLTFNWNLRPDLTLTADYGFVLDGIETVEGQSNGVTQDDDSRFHLSIRYFPKWPFSGSNGGLR